MCYYFGDIIKIEDVVLLVIFYWMKNRTRIFQFMKFHAKL